MHEARTYFTPCAFHGFIYLCGGFTDTIEAFDPDISYFHLLHARLPEERESIAVVERGALVVISGNYETRWSPGADHNVVKVSQTQHPKVELYCNMMPVRAEAGLIVSWRGGCLVVQLGLAETK